MTRPYDHLHLLTNAIGQAIPGFRREWNRSTAARFAWPPGAATYPFRQAGPRWRR